jgi:hypothetical protein
MLGRHLSRCDSRRTRWICQDHVHEDVAGSGDASISLPGQAVGSIPASFLGFEVNGFNQDRSFQAESIAKVPMASAHDAWARHHSRRRPANSPHDPLNTSVALRRTVA